VEASLLHVAFSLQIFEFQPCCISAKAFTENITLDQIYFGLLAIFKKLQS
jgi:hypothetical protein